jgi:hypothetical protein
MPTHSTYQQLVVRCNKASAALVSAIDLDERRASCAMFTPPNTCRAMRKPLERGNNLHRASAQTQFPKMSFAAMRPSAVEAAGGLYDKRKDDDMLTMKQLQKFVKTRNKSGFQSNLQFQIDASASGFGVDDLGDVLPFTIDGFKGCLWKPTTKDGVVWLVEFGRMLYIRDNDDDDTRSMFELMKKAEFQAAA